MDVDRLELDGQWERSVGGRVIDFVAVPGTFAPMGECVLERTFEGGWEAGADERVFLCTEGVLANVRFAVNGREIGAAGPWSSYRFELPAGVMGKGENRIQATVRDIIDEFGPTPGRRFDAGLFRRIYLERRPRAFLADMRFGATLAADHSSAACTVAVEIDGRSEGAVAIELAERDSGRVVYRGEATSAAAARFTLEWPRLWSPGSPNLYRLTATLGGDRPDVLVENVGVRRLETRGPDFFLNGERLVLKGVCRHEFMLAWGYSPPVEAVRRDLALIKHAGFNYVRLVHSPQAPMVCRLAAEIGLLVSEEPGTCFHDLGDERIAGPAVESLRRMVKRDRNSPSILAWFIYNECNPNSGYAVRAAEACRELDPGCLLGMADCSWRIEDIKAMAAAANLSFCGMNIYSAAPADYVKAMKLLPERPLVITEWGGWVGQGNPRALQWLCEGFVLHTRPEETARVAGCAFWAWADYEEFSRARPAAIDGWTVEGLLDSAGNAKPDLQVLSMMCFEMGQPGVQAVPRVEVLSVAPRREESWVPVALDEVGSQQEGLEKEIDAIRRNHAVWITGLPSEAGEVRRAPMPRFGRLLVDGIEFACRDSVRPAHPLLLGEGCGEVVIPVGRRVSGLAVLGQVAFRGGYPSSTIASVHHRDAEPVKAYGTLAAEFAFEFDDGVVVQPLRHGVEILRANDICRWWQVAPRSSETKPGVRSTINKSYEILRLDLWEHHFAQGRRLKSIRWRLKDQGAILLLHAVSVRAEGN